MARTRQSHRRNAILLTMLFLAVLLACAAFLLINNPIHKPKLFRMFIGWRLPTLICMVIASVAIGVATLIFQSIVNNRIVTPALLGMNSIYSFLHTAAVFVFGTGSTLYLNANLSFAADLISMGVVGTLIYWYLFKKTGHNILYIMLIGTVLSSFFGSMQTAMVRVMDPDEYDALLTTLVADFNNVGGEIIVFAIAALAAIALALRKDLKLLDVITMGRDQAINLGVDYEVGVVNSTRNNAMTIATIFGKEVEVDAMMAGFQARIDALRPVLEGKNILLAMYNNNAMSIMDTQSQLNILAAELGGRNLGETVGATQKATHGEDASWETIISLNPEYIFVLDRSTATGAAGEGVLGAREVIENELIKQLDVYKSGNIVYFIQHANVWYTSTGGVQALDTMLADLEAALLK